MFMRHALAAACSWGVALLLQLDIYAACDAVEIGVAVYTSSDSDEAVTGDTAADEVVEDGAAALLG